MGEDIKVGDRVTITDDSLSRLVGLVGVVLAIDTGDPDLPYRVQPDGDEYDYWVRGARKVATEAPQSRAAFVEKAKELLRGTIHHGSDVLEMARFLAGDDN